MNKYEPQANVKETYKRKNKNRSNNKNITILSSTEIKVFDKLPFKNKVVFVHKNMPEIQSAFYIPNSEIMGYPIQKVKVLTDFNGGFTGKRIIDGFDYISFLIAKLLFEG